MAKKFTYHAIDIVISIKFFFVKAYHSIDIVNYYYKSFNKFILSLLSKVLVSNP